MMFSLSLYTRLQLLLVWMGSESNAMNIALDGHLLGKHLLKFDAHK